MESLFEIIKKRSAPGIMVFDIKSNLQYFNEEAGDIIPALKSISGFGGSKKGSKKDGIDAAIRELCDIVKDPEKEKSVDGTQEVNYRLLRSEAGLLFSMRAFCIGHHPKDEKPTHIMVLLERVIERHRTDYDKIRSEFRLTKRESDVLMSICHGLTNREISLDLGIGEYTVKDHIKNLMRKMNAGSRSEIISLTNQR